MMRKPTWLIDCSRGQHGLSEVGVGLGLVGLVLGDDLGLGGWGH